MDEEEVKEDVNYNSQGIEEQGLAKEATQRIDSSISRREGDESVIRSELGLAGEEFIERTVTAKEVIEGNMLDKIPPNFELAKVHGNAKLVKNLDQCSIEHSKVEDIKYFCPCCQLPTTAAAPQYPLCCNVMELEDLGCGFPLYFYFKMF